MYDARNKGTSVDTGRLNDNRRQRAENIKGSRQPDTACVESLFNMSVTPLTFAMAFFGLVPSKRLGNPWLQRLSTRS